MSIADTTTVNTKQPPGLKVLFLVEMWERLGFYTIQTLLVLYLVEKLLFSDQAAYGLFAAFTALTYASPVFGGFFADRYLGFRPAINLGLTLFILGYACLFLFTSILPFHFALALVILGTGFLKGTISSLLGLLYEKNDIRRNAGFTLFYMGINIGSFSASVFCSIIAEKWGFQYAFLLATLGMIAGYFIFLRGRPYLEGKGEVASWKNSFFAKKPPLLLASCVLFAAALSFFLQFYDYISNAILALLALFIVFLVWNATKLGKAEQRRMMVLGSLLIFSTIFWALYFQTFLSVTLFIDRSVDRQVLGFTIPTAMFQGFNPIYIIVLSPLLAKFWLWLEKNKMNPSDPLKFALGLFFMGAGFLVLALATFVAGPDAPVSAQWLIFSFLLQTLGELLLSPTGLSMVTKLAPSNWTSMLMGLWFMSLAAGNALAGKIANFTALPTIIPDNFPLTQFYGHTFNKLGWFSVGIAMLLLICTPLFNRLIAGSEKSL
jgi:POT family proton-dependent oligopeptide transporter